MKRIVVTGGSGFVGRAVCELLARTHPGTRVVVPSRHPDAARSVMMLPNVDVVTCQVSDAGALPALLADADALVHLVAVLHGSDTEFDQVHVQLPRQLAAAVRVAGVSRVVHVSALGVATGSATVAASGPANGAANGATNSAPSAYLRSKSAGEAVWRESGLDVRILRPSVVFGTQDRFTNLFAQLLKLFPVLPLAGADARFQPVWVGDVAAAVVSLLVQAGPAGPSGAVVQAAGPEVLSLGEIVARVGQMAGCPRPVWPLPEGLGMLQARLMGWLPGEPLMSRDNLLSMRAPNVADPALPGLASLGIVPASLALLAPHLAPAQPAYAQSRAQGHRLP